MMVFSGSASQGLTDKICTYLGVARGKNNTITFSDNNTYVKIGEKVRGEDVYIIQTIGLDPNNEFMELSFWLDAFRRSSANSVTAIIPYFGYAKADQKDESRVSIRARVCADFLENAGVDRVVMMDLHSAQVQGFFRRPVDHLYASDLFRKHIINMNLENYVIVSTDEGFAKTARKEYANKLNAPLAIGNKQRTGHDERAEVLDIIGNVEGKTAVVVDDFTISCGTIKDTARVLKIKGAEEIYAFVSHNMLSEKGVKELEKSEIDMLFTTDTVDNPNANERTCKKIKIISAAGLIGDAIRRIHEKESLSDLFD